MRYGVMEIDEEGIEEPEIDKMVLTLPVHFVPG